MENKEREKMNTMSRRENSEKGVERLAMNFWGNKYNTQFTRTGKKKKQFMHDMHRLSLDLVPT